MLTICAKLTADTFTREATDDVEEDEAELEEPRAVINSLARVFSPPLRPTRTEPSTSREILMRIETFS